MGKHSGKPAETWDSNATPQEKADNFDRMDSELTQEHDESNTPALDAYEHNNTGWKYE